MPHINLLQDQLHNTVDDAVNMALNPTAPGLRRILYQDAVYGLRGTMMVHFYPNIIESIFTSSVTIWYPSATATVKDKGKLQ